MLTQMWTLSFRADPAALPLANRHYNRQHPDSPQFVPPGRCLVLTAHSALWVTSWPIAAYVRHEWAGAWVNSCFRRESGPLASDMIRMAIAATVWYFGAPPEIASVVGLVGMVTFIDREKVRHKRDYGRCYRRAGFRVIGETKGGLLALGLPVNAFPSAETPIGANEMLGLEAAC